MSQPISRSQLPNLCMTSEGPKYCKSAVKNLLIEKGAIHSPDDLKKIKKGNCKTAVRNMLLEENVVPIKLKQSPPTSTENGTKNTNWRQAIVDNVKDSYGDLAEFLKKKED